MNEKQQQLTFDKGITNVPSDALCSDNALAESLGLVYDDGEHRVIQKPETFMTGVSGDLLYIHQDRYIFKVYESSQYKLKYRTESSSTMNLVCNIDSGNVKVTSIGRTLIISTPSGLKYALWDSGYKLLGGSIPDIHVNFSIGEATANDVSYYNDRYVDIDGMVYVSEKAKFATDAVPGIDAGGYVAMHSWTLNKQDDAKNAIIGLVSKRLKKVKEDKKFAFPFWVRFAIRLYDGSYTHISNPVLILPTVRHNCNVFLCKYGDQNQADSGKIENNFLYLGGTHYVNYLPESAELKFSVSLPQGFSVNDWLDIIKGVDVFVSREVRGFDIEGDWTLVNPDYRTQSSSPKNHNQVLFDGCYPIQGNNYPKYRESIMLETPLALQGTISQYRDIASGTGGDEKFGCYISPTHYSDNEIIKNLIDNSTFYKLFEVDIQNLPSGETGSSSYIGAHTLENLEEQDQLEYDDYFSYSPLSAEVIKTYNSRLHLANIKRGFFGGFSQFSYTAYNNANTPSLDMYVYIKTDNGERIVKKSVSSWQEMIDIWFYYPDPRAYRVEFYNPNVTGNYILALSLQEHPYLHGAYSFTRLPDDMDATLPVGTSSNPPTQNIAKEELPNTLAVSEVNNPFVFTAKGYNEVGMGVIKGLAIQTTALGQEEHGKHPLLVFMTKGIWVMMVNDEGLYIRSDAFNREVCNNPLSITETDGAVFFTSKKGLMLIVGSQVKCVSEQMSGKTNVFKDGNNVSLVSDLGDFCDYLKNAYIAYDYRDSLLWIFKSLQTICYIYSIKSGTFSKYAFEESNVGYIISNVVNNYPDFLLQSGTNIYSLTGRNDINKDGTVSGGVLTTPNTYSASLLTRPMKLENALTLKSIMQIKHIHDIPNLNKTGSSNPTLTLRIFASNNLTDWVELSSLRGTPWKYYRFRYEFTNLVATSRFSGTMLITQERRTNKLR